MERVKELGKVVESQRLQFLEELARVQEQCEAHQRVTTQRFEEHWQHVEQLDHACHERLAALATEIDERFRQLPDYADAIESLRRLLRRKADLKLLKEYVCRLLGDVAGD
ncbi:hypothetical protein PINS_up008695 [Pythium insidiosum]|nr:hypothetical protein PINS_up008695 [Pythium insidiosum]